MINNNSGPWGNNDNNQSPWGRRPNNQTPPDVDEIIKNSKDKFKKFLNIKNSEFETFLDTMYLKSVLDIRLFFLPVFIKALNSSNFKELNPLKRKDLLLKKLLL